MKAKRALHKEHISSFHRKLEEKQAEDALCTPIQPVLPLCSSEDISDTFQKIVEPKKRKLQDLYKKNKKQKMKDENFIPYLPSDKHTEEG